MVAANQAAYRMFKLLNQLSVEIATDDGIPADVADVFMDHAKWFRIEGLYKLGRAMDDAAPAPSSDEGETVVVVQDDEPEE